MMFLYGKRVKYFKFNNWTWPWLIHGFSTRWGGFSRGEYNQLNLAGKGDNPKNIRKNRAFFLREMGLINPRVFVGEQVHGKTVALVKEDSPRFLKKTDGLLTSLSQGILMAFFADCVPLFFVVPDKKAVGVVHAGWEGTSQRIAGEAVRVICDILEIGPEKIWAGLGPSIGPCCYEIGPEVAGKFSGKEILFHSGSDRFFLDLKKTNVSQLEDAGVPAANIGKSDFCTSCNPHLFFSHRGEGGKTGRMAGLIGIK